MRMILDPQEDLELMEVLKMDLLAKDLLITLLKIYQMKNLKRLWTHLDMTNMVFQLSPETSSFQFIRILQSIVKSEML